MPFFQSSGIVPVLHASWKIRVSHSVQELPPSVIGNNKLGRETAAEQKRLPPLLESL